ncbi:MAG: DUF1566 domain-containing protein [Burkholderiales bacterium]|nr:DUF1566 domain-containing protein [Burkholderiales bacterium]
MNKKNLNLAGIVILASILSSCDLTGAGSGSDSNVRQSSLTISETPLFYYKATTSNQYYLALSNNMDQELSLVGSSITNSSLAESIDFRSMVDTSECNKLAAKSDCRLRIKLPYAKNEGYYTFRMNYQTNDGTDIYVDKVVSFSSSLPESGGLVSSQKFIDSVVINSDRFTLALPIVLDRDYSAIKLEVGNKNERSAYSKIICDTQGVYKRNSSCTALVELDGHIADPQLRLSTTDTNDHINSYNFVTGVVFNNQAHLVYLNAPVIVRSGSNGAGNTVTVLNIGTLVASNLKISLENPSNLSLTQTSNCSANLIPNGSCTITYTPTTPATPVFGSASQNVEYSGGALSTTKGKFPVYRNKAALQAPKVVSIEPANNKIVPETRPQIKVAFSEPVDSNTVDSTSFYLTDSSGKAVNGTISWIDNNIIAFTPTSDLLYGAQYTINLATDKIANSAGKVSTKATTSNFSIFSPRVTVQAISPQNIMMGDTFQFTASIDVGSSLVKAAFVNNPLGGIITPVSCSLDAATKICNFSATILWNTSLANSSTSPDYEITVSASNNVQIVGNSLSFSISTPTVYLPATGQTATTPLAEEWIDGWYQAGIKIDDSQRFESGTGTQANCITDNLTGLMWIKDLNTINNGATARWSRALAIIAQLNTSGECGYKDWHLPTLNELSSLLNYGEISPSAWLMTGGFVGVQANNYWSSTSFAPATHSYAWRVSFSDGSVNWTGNLNDHYVWPVRGGR